MVNFNIEVLGEQIVSRKLLRFEGNVDMTKVAKELYASFLETEQGAFDSQGSTTKDGEWEPLSPNTLTEKMRKHQDSRILRATGTLFRSLTSQGAKGAVFDFDETSVTMGTSIPYAEYHQTGTRHMPQRKPVDPSEAVRRAWVQIIQRTFTEE